MSTFQFDTEGVVPAVGPTAPGTAYWPARRWSDLTPFAQGYFTAMAREAALQFGRSFAFSDFAPETLARGMKDCEALTADFPSVRQSAPAGRDFWLARNHPEGLPRFPPLSLVIAEDGLLHAEEPR